MREDEKGGRDDERYMRNRKKKIKKILEKENVVIGYARLG